MKLYRADYAPSFEIYSLRLDAEQLKVFAGTKDKSEQQTVLALSKGNRLEVDGIITHVGDDGKGAIASTIIMHLLIDGKAVFSDFGEQMNVNDGDTLRVAGDPQANGLRIMAYHNLTNGTHGAGPAANTMVRLGCWFICAMGAAISFIPDGGFIAGVPCVWLGLWLLGMSSRYKAALETCLAGE